MYLYVLRCLKMKFACNWIKVNLLKILIKYIFCLNDKLLHCLFLLQYKKKVQVQKKMYLVAGSFALK